MATIDTFPTITPTSADYLIIERADGSGTSKSTIANAALQGPVGPAGPAGAAGTPGAAGAKGDAGPAGHTPVLYSGEAVTGTEASSTATVSGAVTGDIYLNTSTGNLYGCTGTNTWHYVGCIKGPKGDKGSDGAAGAAGPAGPAGPAGAQGPAGSDATVPIATTTIAGKVIPDGTTITVDSTGKISAKQPDLSNYITKDALATALQNYLERG